MHADKPIIPSAIFLGQQFLIDPRLAPEASM